MYKDILIQKYWKIQRHIPHTDTHPPHPEWGDILGEISGRAVTDRIQMLESPSGSR